MRRALGPVLVLVLGVAGCAGTRTQMISEARPAVAEAAVKVYYQRPPGSIDIAWVEATSGAGFGTQGQHDAAMARLRREAGKLGANGVVVLGGGRGPSPVDVGVGVGAGRYDHNSGGGIGIGGGIPLSQDSVNGVAIWVPAGAEQAAAREEFEQRLEAEAEAAPAVEPTGE